MTPRRAAARPWPPPWITASPTPSPTPSAPSWPCSPCSRASSTSTPSAPWAARTSPAGRCRPWPGWTARPASRLLDRAAEIGLLTGYGGGYYAVHPAIPWHLHTLFTQHYGPPGSPAADHATRAWTVVTSDLGNY